jgi:acyl-CoA synthetase (NDP forming)
VNLKNPLDLTPMASDDVYLAAIQLFLDDPQVDVVIVGIVPLTSMLSSLTVATAPDHSLNSPTSLAGRIARIAAQSARPVVIVIDSGALFDPLAAAFQAGGLPVFRSADQAMECVGQYVQDRLRTRKMGERD